MRACTNALLARLFIDCHESIAKPENRRLILVIGAAAFYALPSRILYHSYGSYLLE
jgi:hypothetical protein